MTTRCKATGIKKSFGTTSILRGVDLEIAEGGFAVLVGPSGCGKSTLLRIVAGLEQVDDGKIEIAGRDVTTLPPRDRDIAMVFQSYALYPHLTVRQNLAFGLELRKTEASVIAERVKKASAMLGLDPLLDRLPKQLSGGQRQRVAMGRAVVRRANLYLFDEPLSNLDAALRAEVRAEIKRLHEDIGATTLYVTHDQTEAMTLADTLWVLNLGKVEQKGAPLDVYEKPRSMFVATFLGSPKMNFHDATLEREGSDWFAKGTSTRAPLRPFADADQGRAVKIGIRPHDTIIGGNAPIGELTVDLVEALGSEGFVHGTFGKGEPFIARLDADQARTVKRGDRIPVSVARERAHVFDPKTELAL